MISFEQIQEANKFVVTTNIKGKEYAEVNQRIKAFRFLYPEGQIKTELITNELQENNKHIVIFKASVYSDNGNLLGTGTAYEVEGSSFINNTSYIENCETSAVGRALAMCGIGIDTSIASYEEVENAKLQQQAVETISELEQKTLISLYEKSGKTVENIYNHFKVDDIAKITAKQYADFLQKMKQAEEKKNANNKV